MLRRTIPHGKDTLPVIGIGTSQVYDVGDDAAKQRGFAAVVKHPGLGLVHDRQVQAGG